MFLFKIENFGTGIKLVKRYLEVLKYKKIPKTDKGKTLGAMLLFHSTFTLLL